MRLFDAACDQYLIKGAEAGETYPRKGPVFGDMAPSHQYPRRRLCVLLMVLRDLM